MPTLFRLLFVLGTRGHVGGLETEQELIEPTICLPQRLRQAMTSPLG